MPTSGKTSNLERELFAYRDEQYANFSAKLIPNIDANSIIGVRAPILKSIAKTIGTNDKFLQMLPHRWHEENMLHAYILCGIHGFNTALVQTERFLPHVTNWAVCDSLAPKSFNCNTEKLLDKIPLWLSSTHEYTVRFGISMLMRHFLDARFRPECLQWVADIKRDEYYIQMMQAWYFATALAKQWDATIAYIHPGALDKWVLRKSIQKAIESYRITPEQKTLLRSLR